MTQFKKRQRKGELLNRKEARDGTRTVNSKIPLLREECHVTYSPLKSEFKTSEEIVKKRRKLFEILNNLNPSLAPQGSNLSYEDYYKAEQEAKDFEQKLWLSKEELENNYISIKEHEKLMNNHPMKKERDNILEQLSQIVTKCVNEHIQKSKVEELKIEYEKRIEEFRKEIRYAYNIYDTAPIINDLINKILLDVK